MSSTKNIGRTIADAIQEIAFDIAGEKVVSKVDYIGQRQKSSRNREGS